MPQRALTRQQMADAILAVERYGSVIAAARALGINRNTLQSRYLTARTTMGIERVPDDGPETVVVKVKPKVRVRAASANENVMRVLGIGDAHDSPEIPKSRFHCIGRHAAAWGAHKVAWIGDALTLDSLNAHIPNHTLAAKTKNPFLTDIQSGHEALGAYAKGKGSHETDDVIVFGNHERRAWTWEEENPESAGLIVGQLTGLFEQHGFRWKPYGEYEFIGGVGFIHAAINRLDKTYGGKNAETTIANDAVFDHVIGHSHVSRTHRAPKLGPSKHVTVLNLGCALPWGHVESYRLHGGVTGWWWGIHELLISGGQIVGINAIPMDELERRYG